MLEIVVPRKKILTGIISLFLLTLALTACGGNQTPAPYSGTPIANLPRLNLQKCTASAASTAVTPQSEPANAATLRVPVPGGFRLFISNVYPYGLAYPDTWVLRDNQTVGNLTSDLFVGERTENGTAFAFVLSEKLEKPTDLKTYLDLKLREARANSEGIEIEQQGDRTVAGQPTKIVAFNYEKPYQVQQIQAVFITPERGWVISYSATPNLGERFCGDFSRILDTFTLTGTK
jgi:hypothetical protein